MSPSTRCNPRSRASPVAAIVPPESQTGHCQKESDWAGLCSQMHVRGQPSTGRAGMEDFAERLKAQLGEADRLHHVFIEEPRHLDELILAFADQSRWQSDRPPTFSLDSHEPLPQPLP